MLDGATKFICHHVPGAAPPDIDDLVRWRNVLRRMALIGVDTDGIGYGNISMRRGDGFVISGTQTGHIYLATEEEFTFVADVDIETNELCCMGPVAASSESMTHAAIYRAASWVNAVAHAHDNTLWKRLIDIVPTTHRDIPYGTPAMAMEFERLLRETSFPIERVAVMGGHDGGLVFVGENLEEAGRKGTDMKRSIN